MCNGSDGTNRANDRSHQSRYEEYTHPPFREQQLGGFGSIGPARVGDSVEQHVALVHGSGGGPRRGVHIMWAGDAVCATDTQAEARSTRRCVIGFHRGVGYALAWTSEREALPGTGAPSRSVGVPQNRHYRRAWTIRGRT